MRKIVLCGIFFVFSPMILFFSIYFYGFFNQGAILGMSVSSPVKPSNLYAALPEEGGVIAYSIKSDNSIPLIVANYLNHYNSPLSAFAETIVNSSEKYGVDPRLIVAIAQQESNLGKSSPENCFNAWGWGIHSRGTKCFESWPNAIDGVCKGIAQNYCQKGYCEDPCVMMKKYTPSSNGSWCFGVKQFLKEMEYGDF